MPRRQTPKKSKKKQNPWAYPDEQEKKPKYNGSRSAFESAFFYRIGQMPKDFIQSKLDAGSAVSAVEYLYAITSETIAYQFSRKAVPFSYYYTPKEVRKVPKVKVYNKLVRDRIPEIIRASGAKCTTETLSHERYIAMLDAKLQEELSEYQESKSLEELADLLEVMGAVVKARGNTWEQLRQVRMKKREERGGFEQRILLKEVEVPEGD